MLVNGVLLVTITAVVLIGTIFPLLSDPLGGVRTSVGPGYYQRTAVPLAIAVLLVMGVTPALRAHDRTQALRRLAVPGGVALATVAVVGLLSRPGPAALTAFGAAAFVLTGLAAELAAGCDGPARTGDGAGSPGSSGTPESPWSRWASPDPRHTARTPNGPSAPESPCGWPT